MRRKLITDMNSVQGPIMYKHLYKQLIDTAKHSQMYAWVTNGTKDLRIPKSDMSAFLTTNTEYKNGRINA